jgi:cystathionine gamma-synthase
MLSFELQGGREAARRFVAALKLFTLAESLGGIESLIAHPKTMTHSYLDAQTMEASGISDGLLRLSVGLENENDLVGDLIEAFAALGW